MPRLSDFELVTSPLAPPGPGECLVRGIYLSLDPYMRGRMDDRKSYAESVRLGQVLVGQVAGRVVVSSHPSH
jgi:NADPH-dependent curcumin reductase CurA